MRYLIFALCLLVCMPCMAEEVKEPPKKSRIEQIREDIRKADERMAQLTIYRAELIGRFKEAQENEVKK
jgi:chorismate mutase